MPDEMPFADGTAYASGRPAPTPDESLREFQRQQRASELMRWARLNDRGVNSLTAAAALIANKGNAAQATQWLGETPGKLTREGIGMLASYGLIGGGSPTAMMAGISQFTGASNMRVNAFGGSAQLYGGGAVADMISKRMFNDVQNSMFSRTTGLADLQKTSGFDKGQMGQIFGLMGQRGMFAGSSIGSLGFNSSNKLDMKLDDTAMEGIKKTFTDTAKLLANVRNLVGDRSISELAREAEQLTGISLRSGASPAALNSRIERMRETASLLGVDEGAYSQFHKGLMSMAIPMLGNGASAAQMASSMAMNAGGAAAGAYTDRQGMVNRMRQRGGPRSYLANFSQEEIATQGMTAQMRLMKENPMLLEASYAASTLSGDETARAALQESIAAMGNISSPEERESADIKMRAALEKFTGKSAGTFTKLLGTAGMMRSMSPEAMDKLTGVYAGMDQGLNKNLFRDMLGTRGLSQRYFGGKVDAAKQADMAHLFATQFAGDTQDELMSKLESGDIKGFNAQMETHRDRLRKQGVSDQQINQFMGTANQNAKGMGNFLGDMRKMTAAIPGFANMTNSEQRARDAEKLITDKYFANFSGDIGDRAGESGFSSFMRGLTGGQPIDNQTVMSFLAEQTDKSGTMQFKMGKNGMVQSAEEARKLAEIAGTYGDVGAAMGIGNDPTGEKFFKSLQTKEGQLKYYQFMGDKGVAFTGDYNGNMAIASRGTRDAAKDRLGLYQQASERARLAGFDPMTDKDAMEGFVKEIQGENAAMTAAGDDPMKRGQAHFAGVEATRRHLSEAVQSDKLFGKLSDTDSESFQSLSKMYKGDSKGTIDALRKGQEAYEKGDHSKQEKENRRAGVAALEEKLKESTKSAADRSYNVLVQIRDSLQRK